MELPLARLDDWVRVMHLLGQSVQAETHRNRLALAGFVPARPSPAFFGIQPRCAASIAAMSILFISIIASNARLAAAGSGSLIALVSAMGVICHDKPHLSLHQPHELTVSCQCRCCNGNGGYANGDFADRNSPYSQNHSKRCFHRRYRKSTSTNWGRACPTNDLDCGSILDRNITLFVRK